MSVLEHHEVNALRAALDDEQRAWATYSQVIADFGRVRPFIHIRDAEARHMEAITALLRSHGLDVPDNPWPGRVPHFASLLEACEAAVEEELANGAHLGRLIDSTTRPDIRRVLRNLQRASQERHLPAFIRHAARRSEAGPPAERPRHRRAMRGPGRGLRSAHV